MKELIGTKVGMTGVFQDDGVIIPVTVLEVDPNIVVGLQTKERNGYVAARVGHGDKRKSIMNKPTLGVYAKAGIEPKRRVLEIRYEGDAQVGQAISVEVFKAGELVDIQGTSKGLGFQGTVRRHGFGGGPVTHGQSDRTRAPGSVGSSSFPSRVFKGMRMAGHMGADTVTAVGLKVVRVVAEKNLILVRGSVPGKNGSLVRIRSSKRGRRYVG